MHTRPETLRSTRLDGNAALPRASRPRQAPNSSMSSRRFRASEARLSSKTMSSSFSTRNKSLHWSSWSNNAPLLERTPLSIFRSPRYSAWRRCFAVSEKSIRLLGESLTERV